MKPTIQLTSGKYFYFTDFGSEDIDIRDIAHALANVCRFAGHTRKFYSVAQHSVIVSEIVDSRDALAGLLHDATEAYIGDMTRPLKSLMPKFIELEHDIWRAVADKFRLRYDLPPGVKAADNIALLTEKRDLMPRNLRQDPVEWEWAKNHALVERIRPLQPFAAEKLFRQRYFEITGEKI